MVRLKQSQWLVHVNSQHTFIIGGICTLVSDIFRDWFLGFKVGSVTFGQWANPTKKQKKKKKGKKISSWTGSPLKLKNNNRNLNLNYVYIFSIFLKLTPTIVQLARIMT